ncbi:hypothetical protein M3Y97_00069400 [Aphelenchoides bicaudatus]|nr:hypothetical protein M3Y97_00069400 [Aphelenchoides bicaudatus]
MLIRFASRLPSVYIQRLMSSTVTGEQRIMELLRKQYPNASLISVNDVSGGCGSFYQVAVHTPEFKGLLKIQQHKQITDLLKNEIKEIHGLTIETKS